MKSLFVSHNGYSASAGGADGARRRAGRCLSWLLVGIVGLLGAMPAFADQFYFTRVRATVDAEAGATGLFLWNDATGAQSQIGGNGSYLRHATDGPMPVVGIATNQAGTLYGFAIDNASSAGFLPWDPNTILCAATNRSRLVTINTTTAVITYVGSSWLNGRSLTGAGFDGQGRLWAVDCIAGEIVQIDPNTGAIVGTPLATGLPVNALGLADIDFAANGLGIIGYSTLQFQVFDPVSRWIAPVSITAQSQGFDGTFVPPYVVAGAAFTNHLSARNGDAQADTCRLNIGENRGIDELGHVNDPFFANPVLAYKDAEQFNPPNRPAGFSNGGPGDMARVGGPALPSCFYDWGDAPASYGTLRANNGARHLIAGPYLGAAVPDFEVDGQAGPATGDDTTGTGDEDGVVVPTLTRGTTMQIEVTAGGVGASTRLQGWIDWDGDGSFAQPGDRILTDASVSAGVNTFSVSVPATAAVGTTYARFRIADQSGLGFDGAATSGEVEDYAVLITAGQPLLTKVFGAGSIPYGSHTALTFTIDNTAAGAGNQSGIAFTDNLPTGLMVATPANVAATCAGAVVNANPGGSTIAVSDVSVPAGQTCTISVEVTNRPGYSGVCFDPNFANENQNITGLNNLAAAIAQYTCLSVEPPECPDAGTTNGFDNIVGLSPNLSNGVGDQCVAISPTIELIKISQYATGTFGFTLSNTSATGAVSVTTTAAGAPGTSAGVFDVVDMAQPVTIVESALPAGWTLSGIACQLADGSAIGSFDAAGGTLSIAAGDLAYGQQITCTATNTADRFDFGDAPDSYGTLLASNGPRHDLGAYDAAAGTAALMLGARVDHENDGAAGAAADGDDASGIDDEDAFFGPIALQPGATSVSLDVPVTNTTGGNANLYAWIDFNGNGRFDVAEAGTCAAVAAGATQATCTWTAPAPLADGFQTYARFRLTTQALAAGTAPNGGDARAQGAAADGEVEDHRVSVATVLPLTCEAPFVETFGTYAAAPGAFPGWGTPLPAGTTTYVFQRGSAAPANTVGGGQYALMTNPSLSHSPAWQNAPDHTPGDTDGFMMVVNASPAPGVFYRRTFSGLTIGARYSFFASLANIVAGLNAGLPNVTLRIVDPATNAVLASMNTGNIPEDPAGAMRWHAHQLVFAATQADVRVELANNSGVQGGNDLALDDIGFAQVCELGDAPDSYATLNASNGAGHLFPGAGLSLGGGLPDGEMDGQPGPNADGDDLAGSDDENAFPTGAPALVIGAPYALTVPVETTAGAATACAWVDLDQNGSFSAAEGQCQPLAAGATTAGFTWPAGATAGLASGQTYLRLRIERAGTFPTDMSTADFAGVRGPGEVEDYVVAVLTPANVTLVKALTGESGSLAGAAEPGEQLTYTITLTNSGGTPATNYGVTDALDPNVTFVSASNGGTAAGGAVNWGGLTVPANGSLTLTVVVQVADPIPAGVTQIGNVAYETGTTPPPCPPAGGQCVVVPTAPKVTVAKALTGESGTLAGQAEAGEQLTYTITLTNTGGTAATNYGVTDTLDPNVTFVSASNGGVATGGAVNWTGLTVPANGSLTLTIVVRVADPIPAGVTQIGNVAYETGTTPPPCPPAGGQCVVVPTAPKIAVSKTASTPAPAGTPNQYSITYVVAVRNDGGSAGTYDLADTLTFNGATVTAISTPAHASGSGDPQTGTPGAFSAPGGGTIVTGEGLAPQGEETWTYTVTYTVTDADTAADCADPAGGLRNHALLGGASAGAPAADTCSGAPSVGIVKTAAAPVPTGTPNQFTMTYTVDVTNGGTLPGVYDLADTLTFNGATVDAITAPAYASSTGDVQDGTLGTFAAPTGGTIVTGESVAAGGTETWTYTVTYTVTDAATAQDCADPNGGLRNLAELGGSLSGQSTTCTGAPAVNIGKSAGGPLPTGNAGEYALDYLVSVQNNGTLPGTYDLADTFTFAGVTVVSVSPVTHAGSDPLAATLGTLTATGGTIVAGETIAAGASETYAYRVVFTLDDVAAVGTCAAGGGLKNQAALGGSSSGQVGTCSDVPDIAITKAAGAPAPTGTPNQYTMTYVVTVDNAGAAAGSYDLSDAFAFAGATVDAVSVVTHGGSDPLATALGTLTPAGGSIVTGETIAALAEETYTYTVTFTVTDPAAAADCANPAGGLRNAAALGGSAIGDAATCTGAPNVAIVKALSAESGALAGQAEPGEQLTYTITLTNSGGSDATNYGVTDTLDPNVTFVSASNGGTAAAGAVTWSGLTVPANGTLTLTVVVQVVDPIPAGVAQIGNVAYETGTTPPPCPPAGGQCVVVPTAPSVTLAKTLTAESGSRPGEAEAGEQLTYTITLTNSGGSDAVNYGVTDTLDPNVLFVSASNGGTAAAGAVTWSGLTVPANGTLTLTVVVQVVDPIPAGVTQIGNVAYETGTTPPPCPPAGGQCVVVPTAPKLALAKSAGAPTPTGAPNQYAITYVVTVRNDGGSVGSYDLADTLTFNGATVTAVSTPVYAGSSGEVQDGVLGGIGAPNGGSIVGNERIGALGTESWTYTVTYTIDDADLAADCAAPNGGLRNQAALGGAAAGTPPAGTCTGAPSVSIVKTVSAPVPTGSPNQFTLTYVVDVANTGTLAGRYDLADTLSFNGATVDAVSVPAYGSGSGDTQDGTPGAFAAPAGGTIVTGEAISAGGAESWTYLVTYTVTDPATAQDCASPSGGLRNRAQLGGSLAGQSTTCTGAPAVVIGKSASGPTPTGNPNEYRLTYLVNVQNDGTLPGNYDLADTFTFAGANVVSVSAVQHAGSDPLATPLGTLGAGGGSIVAGESIAAGADENYTYSVIFTIGDVAAIGTCADGGGLKNHAALGGSSAGQVETCSDVPDVTVSKTASGPTPTGTPNQYAIVYTVAVDNGGGADGSYDLADTFAFAGATVDAVSAVTHAGPDPLATTLGTLTPGGGSIVTAETIAAGGSESYTYTVTFTLTDADLADDCANPAGGLRNTAALGGSAIGDARTCTGTPLLAIVKTLTGESGSTAGVAEPGEQLTYTITLSNSGSSDAVGQAITDRLDANVTFVSADNGGTLVGGNVQWTGLTVPAGGSLALTVTVRVADPIPDGVTSIGNVAYDPGIGEPDCTATPRPSNCTVTPTPSVVTIVKALAAESGSLPGVAEPGEQLTYTITLSNAGGSDATGYGVTDALDPNTSFVSADNGGVHAGGVVTWSGLTVPANGSLVLTVVVQVADPLPAGVTQVANVAYQTGTTPPPCPPAGGQCVVVPTEGAVVIVKTLSGESGSLAGVAEPGEQLTYTIALTNTGGSAVSGYAVSDRLDPNTTFVSASNGGAFAAGVVNWSGLAIPANGTLSLTVVVQVVDPIPAGVTQIGNVAYETGTTPPTCPPAGGQCVVTPTAGAVRIVKSVVDASGNGLAEPGEQLTYTIALTNTGGTPVTNYAVTDPLDVNTRFVSADNGGVHAAGVVNWSGLTVPANGTLNLTLVVQVNDPLPAGVTLIGNVAYQTGTTPPDCNDKGRPPSCVDIEVPPQTGVPRLSITKTASSAVLQPGGTVVYTITVRNVGSADASDVVVSDPIPVGIDAYAWTCAATGLTCPNASGSGAIAEQIASFPVGASVVYTVTATLSADPPATVNNTATVTPGGIATCADGSAPPCPATAIGTVVQPRTPLPVPTVHLWAQLLIALSLFGLAWRRRRS